MKKKALILYISKFSGHFHAACAIEKGLREVFGDVCVEKVDALSYTNPILEKVINKAYLEVIKKKPEIWGNMYDNPDVVKKTKGAREALHKFNTKKMKKLISTHAPDIVYCTQAFPCGMVAGYKKTYGENLPLVGVLTDHAPHFYWLHDEVDHYVVPSEETARILEQKGVPADRIKSYGIPVDPKFRSDGDARQIREKLGIEAERPVILIMGGTHGLGAIRETVTTLAGDNERRYQLLVVTGSNKKLYRRLKRFSRRKNRPDMHIFSYVDNIDELMQVSDLIVTKAGGMTIAEALVKRLPMVIVSPIPGHERRNADYLVKNGVAVEAMDVDQIYQIVNDLIDSRSALNKMKKNAAKIARPESAINIAKLASDAFA
ncbi:MAG: glycosyltransferase [Candidatus Omnitrophota bacterium]